MKDFHSGPRIEQEQLGRAPMSGMDFLAVPHQWGKEQLKRSIHAFPSQFSTSGPQKEAWGYFTGRLSRQSGARARPFGDGHSGSQIDEMKRSEDDAFRFTLSWMTTNQNEKGWVIHYRAKNQPVSAEVMPVLGFLGLRIFNECQFFDFEECWWTDFAYSTRGGSVAT